MKIKFLPQNIEVEGTPDKSLLKIATENQLEIRSICKGVPSCAECRVKIVAGEGHVLPPNKAELALIGTNYFIDGRRLSCQVRCFGDVTVDLSEQLDRSENQVKKIRGFRSQKQVESHAVNDTMLLTEKPEKGDRTDRSDHLDPLDRPNKSDRSETSNQLDQQALQSERADQSERSEQPQNNNKSNHNDKSQASAPQRGHQRPQRSENSQRNHRRNNQQGQGKSGAQGSAQQQQQQQGGPKGPQKGSRS